MTVTNLRRQWKKYNTFVKIIVDSSLYIRQVYARKMYLSFIFMCHLFAFKTVFDSAEITKPFFLDQRLCYSLARASGFFTSREQTLIF